LEFKHFGLAMSVSEHKIYPIQRVAYARGWVADPIPYLDVAVMLVEAPWNTGCDDVPTSPVQGVTVHPQFR
jgi:hypothetical protein